MGEKSGELGILRQRYPKPNIPITWYKIPNSDVELAGKLDLESQLTLQGLKAILLRIPQFSRKS